MTEQNYSWQTFYHSENKNPNKTPTCNLIGAKTKCNLWVKRGHIPAVGSAKGGREGTKCECVPTAACNTVQYVSPTGSPAESRAVSSYSFSNKVQSTNTIQLKIVTTLWDIEPDMLTGSFSCALKTERGDGSGSRATASCCCTHPLVWRDLACETCICFEKEWKNGNNANDTQYVQSGLVNPLFTCKYKLFI